MSNMNTFAFNVGQVLGGLHNLEITNGLKEKGVTDKQVDALKQALSEIAESFYKKEAAEA